MHKNVYKNIFINKYKYVAFIKNCKKIFKKQNKFKPDIVNFKKNDIIKSKIYLANCAIKKNKWQSDIIITDNKYIFSINNRI